MTELIKDNQPPTISAKANIFYNLENHPQIPFAIEPPNIIIRPSIIYKKKEQLINPHFKTTNTPDSRHQ